MQYVFCFWKAKEKKICRGVFRPSKGDGVKPPFPQHLRMVTTKPDPKAPTDQGSMFLLPPRLSLLAGRTILPCCCCCCCCCGGGPRSWDWPLGAPLPCMPAPTGRRVWERVSRRGWVSLRVSLRRVALRRGRGRGSAHGGDVAFGSGSAGDAGTLSLGADSINLERVAHGGGVARPERDRCQRRGRCC